MIIPIWQKIGQSSHMLAQLTGKKLSEKSDNPIDKKATHTGTLDPMAEGVLVVLTGEDRFKKQVFSNWEKTYEFEVLFGVNTDSHDLLGLVVGVEKKPINTKKIEDKLNKIFPNFIGKQEQVQPTFSAQRVAGKSAFNLAKNNKNFTAKINKIEILSLKILNFNLIQATELEKNIVNKISLVKGDFRQKEIISKWKKTLDNLSKNKITQFTIFKIRTTVSKRTYIRAITRDLMQKIGIPATTFSIIRIKNGEFTKGFEFSELPEKYF